MASLSQDETPKRSTYKQKLKLFLILPMWCLSQKYKRNKKMTISLTNAFIIGAVFIFAARVFIAF